MKVVAFLRWNPFHSKLYDRKSHYDLGGEYNGYVAFKGDLPLSYQSGVSFDSKEENVLDYLIGVHGGITFDQCSTDVTCPLIPLTPLPSPEELKNYRCIGFDTLHCDDTLEKWPFEAVKEETLNLMRQIEELLSLKNSC